MCVVRAHDLNRRIAFPACNFNTFMYGPVVFSVRNTNERPFSFARTRAIQPHIYARPRRTTTAVIVLPRVSFLSGGYCFSVVGSAAAAAVGCYGDIYIRYRPS